MLSKKFLLLLIILIRSSFAGQSQVGDTICIPVAQMKAVYTSAQLYRYTDSLLKISESQARELQNKIDLYKQKDASTVNGYNRQLQELKEEIAQYKLEKKEYERLLKWERFKRRFWTGVGAATIGVVGFLYITK